MADLDLNTLDFNKVALEEGQFVTDAILVIRSSLDGGRSRLTLLVTDNMDFIVGRGMISTAKEEIFGGEIFIPDEEKL